MSVTSVGSSKKFAAGWDGVFGGKRAKAKPGKAQRAEAKTQAKRGATAKGKTLATAATPSPNGTKSAPKPKKRAMHAAEPAAAIKSNRQKSAKKPAPAKPKAAKKRKPVLLQRELF